MLIPQSRPVLLQVTFPSKEDLLDLLCHHNNWEGSKQTSIDRDDMMARMFLRGPLVLNPISFKSASLSALKANPFMSSSA